MHGNLHVVFFWGGQFSDIFSDECRTMYYTYDKKDIGTVITYLRKEITDIKGSNFDITVNSELSLACEKSICGMFALV